jgi:hydroxymethylpyrimidine pyrophosphatase-like HAD family hydrolase
VQKGLEFRSMSLHTVCAIVSQAICDHLGCTLADTIGFGDSDNDLQMTDVVGISVCMANGSENLKKRCDRIAPSVYEDGIAKEFKALGLI